VRKSKKREHWEDLGVDGSNIKRYNKEEGGREGTRLMWLRIAASGELL
jgi:hypothetical protein